MKSKKIKNYLLPLGLVLVFGVLGSFTIHAPFEEQRGGRILKELLPFITEKRAELDKSLSKKEKARIVEMKDQLKEIRDKMAEIRKQGSEGDEKPKGRARLSEQQRSQLEALHWERQKIMSEAFLIADTHKNEIMTLTSDIKVKARELMEKADDAEDRNEENNRMDRRGGRKGKFHGHHGDLMERHTTNPAHFILFDADRIQEHMERRKKRD